MDPTSRKFARLARPDPRDRGFALAPPRALAAQTASRHWAAGFVFDQGATSECVAYSTIGWLRCAPVRNDPGFTFSQFYRECQDHDPWPGNDYAGTSVRAAFKLLKAKGFVSEYRWAFDVGTVVDHLLTRGPVVLGTAWTAGMAHPDAKGFVRPTGRPLGGHAYLAVGANRDKAGPGGARGAIRVLNSWGRDWGQGGRAWLGFQDLAALLADQGDAAAAVEVAVPA